MRTPVALLLLAVALSGCVDGEAPAVPDRLLVRVFLEDHEAVVRVAAVTGSVVHGFDGHLEVLLLPDEGAGWQPRATRLDVRAADFADAVLPYVEVRLPVEEGRPGDMVFVEAEATLADGWMLRGEYATVF